MMGYTISKGIWLDSKPRSSLALPGYAKTMDFSNYAVSSFLPRNEEGLNFSLSYSLARKLNQQKLARQQTVTAADAVALYIFLQLYENSWGLHTISEIKSLECNTCKKFDTYLFLETLKEHRAEK